MPKFNTSYFYYQTKTGDGKILATVNVSADGFFYCSVNDIPEEIRNKMPSHFPSYVKHIKAETYADFKGEIEKLITLFEELNFDESKEKVILYKILFQGKLSDEYDKFLDIDAFNDAKMQLGMGLSWFVGFKHMKGNQVRYTYNSGQEVRYIGKMQEMPWSQEREEFFFRIEESLRSTMIKIHDFLKSPDPAELMKLIDSGLKMIDMPGRK